MKMPIGLVKMKFFAKKNAPAILVGAGIVGSVTAAVMACKATLEVKPVLEKHKEDMEKIHELCEQEENQESKGKMTTATYVRTGKKLAKLYLPAMTVGALSITAILGSHMILSKRNAALAGALTTINTAFNEYRGRVISDQGEEKDYEYLTGVHEEEIERIVTDKKGKEKVVKEKIKVADPNAKGNGYLRFLTEGSRYWNSDSQMMNIYLNKRQRWANDQLKSFGFFTIADLWKDFGFVIDNYDMGEYMTMGWIYDKDHHDEIDLDIRETKYLDEYGNERTAFSICPNPQRNVVATYNKRKVAALQEAA